MNRRSFLTVLSSGLVALSLPPLEWMPGVPIDAVAAADLTTVAGITAAMVREMAALMPDLRGTFMPGAYKLGEHGLRSQWNIAAEAEADGSVSQSFVIKPAARALMDNLREKRIFGALPITGLEGCAAAVAIHERTGLCVRGVLMPNHEDVYGRKLPWYRFDVVAG